MASINATNTSQLTADGQLIIGKTGGLPASATITAGANVSVTNAANSITIATSGGAGIWSLLSTVTASSSATVDFTSAFAGGYNLYMVVITAAIPATNAITFQARVSQSAVFDSTSGHYGWGTMAMLTSNSQAETTFNVTNQTSVLLNATVNTTDSVSNTTTKGIDAVLYLFNPNGASVHKRIAGDVYFWGGTSAAPSISQANAMFIANTTAIDGLRFIASSGNINSGVFKLYALTA